MSPRILTLVAVLVVASPTYAKDPIYRETITRHARQLPGEKFDQHEYNPKLREVFAAADAAAERRVGNAKRDDKFVFHFWSAKKEILRRNYNIDWKTPAELNPQIAYGSYGEPQIAQRDINEITPVIRKRTTRRITTIERDFEGKVTVWTEPDGNQAKTYEVRKSHNTWKVVHENVVIFD